MADRRRVGAGLTPASTLLQDERDEEPPHKSRPPALETLTAWRWVRARLLRWSAVAAALAAGAALPALAIKAYKAQTYNQPLPAPDDAIVAAGLRGWCATLEALRTSTGGRKYVIVDAQYGLGNRLRTLASAMAVAAAERRPLLVVWTPDLHCNCSVRNLFAAPLPFAVVEEPTPPEVLRRGALTKRQRAEAAADEAAAGGGGAVAAVAAAGPAAAAAAAAGGGACACACDAEASARLLEPLQVFDYMTGRGGASADQISHSQWIDVDLARHLLVRSAFMLTHVRGHWLYARWQLLRLAPAADVAPLLVADRSYVGIHVRSVFDAPRSDATAKDASGAEALAAAGAEYGRNQSAALQSWRDKGRWPQFVGRIAREPASTRFYLAADTQEAYDGLMGRFPGRIVRTRRECGATAERCDFRHCGAVRYALADMLNLARTSRVLGSYYSSFSEVAALGLGTSWPFGRPVPREYAGVDFGEGVDEGAEAAGGS